MFEQDWIMRQISMLVQFVARLLFHQDAVRYEIADEAHLSHADLLYQRVERLLREGNFCAAEDLLFEEIERENPEYLKLALHFYGALNKRSDEELEAGNFPRREIGKGLEAFLAEYGVLLPPELI